MERTISMSNQAPVVVDEEAWPVIASARWCDKPQCPSEANRKARLFVREHVDGRRLVYGSSSSQWPGEGGGYGGYLITEGVTGDRDGQTVDFIRRVAEEIGHRELAADCIADLPPVVLS